MSLGIATRGILSDGQGTSAAPSAPVGNASSVNRPPIAPSGTARPANLPPATPTGGSAVDT